MKKIRTKYLNLADYIKSLETADYRQADYFSRQLFPLYPAGNFI
ncbi:MAG: hypothetical protein Q8O59_01235 [bacterium]|nr:hypothetical protein [bacterium]